MGNLFQIFRQYLQSRRIIFTDIDEDMVLFEYTGQAMEKIPLVCYIPQEDPTLCSLVCPEVIECEPEAVPEALKICNLMNVCSPAVNIHIDDNKVCVSSIIRVHKEYFCEDIMEMLSYMAEAADGTYMQFQERME